MTNENIRQRAKSLLDYLSSVEFTTFQKHSRRMHALQGIVPDVNVYR